ncbi:hypothetical protein [uncultured Maribacter sp.]|uniref:hypothetical protein n=1 Tax=uncultured Maribacter sp. TaxID=431308 RepID=UPI0026286346|nr:hypothetical protein [uncultured Maribacter sp.]
MTKKFITGESEKGSSEFVIPDIIEEKDRFIGIESGKIYESGLICYTGVELSVDKVIEKILENRSLNFIQKRRAKKVIDLYLKQIKTFKISNSVKLGNGYKLEFLVKK